MITIPTKSANYDPENVKFFHNLSYFCFGNKLFSSFVICLWFNYKVTDWKRNKSKVVLGSRVLTHLKTLLVNLGYLSTLFAKVTLAVGLPYLLVNRVLQSVTEDF